MPNLRRKTDISDRIQDREYTVYTYRRLASEQGTGQGWERRHITTDRLAAYRRAKELYESAEFRKVEIKQKFFDPRRARPKDRTLKIFGPGSVRVVNPVMEIAVALLCGFIGFSLSYVLVGGWG